jgi:hypothetical protein
MKRKTLRGKGFLDVNATDEATKQQYLNRLKITDALRQSTVDKLHERLQEINKEIPIFRDYADKNPTSRVKVQKAVMRANDLVAKNMIFVQQHSHSDNLYGTSLSDNTAGLSVQAMDASIKNNNKVTIRAKEIIGVIENALSEMRAAQVSVPSAEHKEQMKQLNADFKYSPGGPEFKKGQQRAIESGMNAGRRTRNRKTRRRH